MPAAKDDVMPQLDIEVVENIDVLVRSAFWERDQILEIVCEELYAPGELDEEAVSLAIDTCMARWRSSQQDWPDVTDCDRLDEVFIKLNQRDVIALHNAGMTQSDGYDAFQELYANHPRQSELVGYCYYHGQDLERAVRGGPLFISFGPCDPRLEETEGPKVGQLIFQQLTDAGLTVEWDGKFSSRIRISDFAWQRRTAPN
jgi:hypothetical protein